VLQHPYRKSAKGTSNPIDGQRDCRAPLQPPAAFAKNARTIATHNFQAIFPEFHSGFLIAPDMETVPGKYKFLFRINRLTFAYAFTIHRKFIVRMAKKV